MNLGWRSLGGQWSWCVTRPCRVCEREKAQLACLTEHVSRRQPWRPGHYFELQQDGRFVEAA